MCVLCDKVTFAIESLEQLIPEEEWARVFSEAMAAMGTEKEVIDRAMLDKKSLMVNAVLRVASVWTIDKLKVHPEHAVQAFAAISAGTAMGMHEYEMREQSDPMEKIKEILRQKLRDLES